MAKSRPGRLSGKAARRASIWHKPRTWAVVGLAAAVLAAGGITFAVLDDSGSTVAQRPQGPGDKWQDQIRADLTDASQGTLDYLRVTYDWINGKTDAAAMGTAADRAFENFMEARKLLAAREPFEPAPRALANFRDSFELYTETSRLAKLGTGIASGDLRVQVQRQIQRLRTLADRFYDLAKDELKPHTYQDAELGSAFEFVRNPDVPDFAGDELAPGLPLTGSLPVLASKRTYRETRPEQAFGTWTEAVRELAIPGGQQVADAVTSGTLTERGELAVRLVVASNTLHETPDPAGLRHLATRIQLGLLVASEALRAAQIAGLATKDERPVAVQIAQTLALVGNRIWDPRLGDRTIDLPERLLERKPI